jgi:hypothetical protein
MEAPLSCDDYARHERLLECSGHDETVMVAVELADGCSGRLCPDCQARLGVRHWPDVADRIAGPAGGLDVLDMLRALTSATNAQIFERDGWRCVVCGGRAQSVHHRVHGNRSDRRPSNLVSTCGDGTRGDHGWIEAHFKAAAKRGWTVSRHDRRPTAEIPVFMANGPLGTGEYLLGDDLTLNLAEAR